MLVGCVNPRACRSRGGFFSKDTIIAECFVTPNQAAVGWVLLITAGMTAYYTFRVFFRVFMGPLEHHPGDERTTDDHECTARITRTTRVSTAITTLPVPPAAPGWATEHGAGGAHDRGPRSTGLTSSAARAWMYTGTRCTPSTSPRRWCSSRQPRYVTPYDRHAFEAAEASHTQGGVGRRR
ncbi:MAG: hypothetical protein R3B49_02465 [Phycisphaerales bacterium]